MGRCMYSFFIVFHLVELFLFSPAVHLAWGVVAVGNETKLLKFQIHPKKSNLKHLEGGVHNCGSHWAGAMCSSGTTQLCTQSRGQIS